MKICITALNPTMDSLVDPRFGRCHHFIIVDEKGKLIKNLANESGEAARGAGVSAAQVIADEGVQVIITGNMGPNAYKVLSPSKIKIFTGVANISVKEAFEAYQNNELQESDPDNPQQTDRPFGHGKMRD
jgi:predicted Fe-Mo cluster-binding NifX family protein